MEESGDGDASTKQEQHPLQEATAPAVAETITEAMASSAPEGK